MAIHNPFENTLFINLNERTDRLQHIQEEFKKIGITNAIRIEAIKMDIGAIGCGLSHIKSLNYAKQMNFETCFICEDDITFLKENILIENTERFFNKSLQWDVVVIGGNNCPPYQIIDDSCCKISNCQTTTGYIVKKHYYDTLIENFTQSVYHLMREPNNTRQYALDIYWKSLQKKDNWFMILPPTVSQYENYSDIEKKNTNYHWLMLDIEKKWLNQRRN
jgi:glycosyl transferase family 25